MKNIKRYQRQQRREVHGHSMHGEELDIIPATYVLPQDCALFVEVRRYDPNGLCVNAVGQKGLHNRHNDSQRSAFPFSFLPALVPVQQRGAVA